MEQAKSYEELQSENEHLQQRLQEMEQAQRRVQEHAGWLEALFERAAIGLATASMQGNVLYSNPVFQSLLGYTQEELSGMHYTLFTHPDDLHSEDVLLAELIGGQCNSYQIDKRYIRKDGQVVWVRARISLLYDSTENPSMLLASVEDINEQKRMQETLTERDERMRLVLDATNDGVWDWHIPTGEVYFSDGWQRMIGYEPGELEGHVSTWENLLHPDDKTQAIQTVNDYLQAKTPSYESEFRMQTKSGGWKWILDRGKAVERDIEGKPVRMIGSYVDITEQKKVEQTLQHSHDMLDTIMNSIDALIYVSDMETYEMVYMNKNGIDAFGAIGDRMCWQVLQVDQTGPCAFCTNDRLLDAHGNPTAPHRWEFQNTLNGRWYNIVDQAIRWIDGRMVRIEVATDIDAMKKDAEALRMFKTLADNSPDALGIAKPNGEITYANPAFRDMFGYGDDTIGMINVTLFTEEDQQERMPILFESIMAKGFWTGMLTGVRKDGSTFPAHASPFAIYDSHNNLVAIPAIIRNLTEQQRQEQALRASESRYRSTHEHSPIGIFRTTIDDGRFIDANPALARMFGYGSTEELIANRTAQDLYANPTQRAELMRKLESSQGAVQFELHLQRRDGRAMIGSLNAWRVHNEPGEPSYLEGFLEDITEQKRAEDERKAFQEQIIEAQQAALRELSAPLLPISESVVIMPLIGSIDTRRAQHIMETLLEGVAQYQADIAIVDITGIKVVDTQIADALIRAAQAVKLLGSQVVLTGIGPAMAQTLVHLGADLSSIVTRGSLQSGIAWAMQSIGDRC